MPKLKKKKKAPTLAALKQIAWKKLSLIVRISGTYSGGLCRCYTCGTIKYWREMQAGHAIGGRNMAVLFDEEIIKPQCMRCNIMLSGNYGVFATKLIKAKGMAWWENKLAHSKDAAKESRQDMQDRIDIYSGILSEHPNKYLLDDES